ncbi:staphylococcal nuclease domain-containing protein 1-like [Artemia franciscana]|uniref:Staphylococcal nuclease domain-containing protein 1 n=1 Tax=Artemia franciscana TaxID=6661 RepID=A0AA88L137_ARTSF|nr:hypothetical protein QYM36_011296 [Artemia franciscana]
MASVAANPAPAPPPVLLKGIVRQVISGDSLVIRGQPKNGPPPEKTVGLAGIIAPKIGRKPPNSEEIKDEPYGFDAREFLRKKVVGKEITFQTIYTVPVSGREYGILYLGRDTSGENLNEALITEGLASVKPDTRGGAEHQRLVELEGAAKSAGRGKWSTEDPSSHVRNIKWSVENPRAFVEKMGGRRISAVVEFVRDGSTMRVLLLPEHYNITLMLSGVRSPGFKLDSEGKPDPSQTEPFAEEAKFFVESRVLQRDVEVILESTNNANFVGSLIHPNGNIAELLVKEGFARCVDWSIATVTGGPEKLRAAERQAKEKRLRIWQNYSPTAPTITGSAKQFSGKVLEVVNGDAIVVKHPDGSQRKIFLASIRPPRPAEDRKVARPLYDIPWMYEAREFLRKRLIGKKVEVTVDYIQPKSEMFPEKVCATVIAGDTNVAEALVAKGLATVVRYRQDDDQRSSSYDELLAAELKAIKSGNGVHSKKDPPVHRVQDISGDPGKAKQFLPFLQRAGKTEAVVEFVASGSRVRLYIPKETCQITFLLNGISCPRASRATAPVGVPTEGEPYGDEALQYTKELCHQREVSIEVESIDKGGNFIGWLWVESKNLSVELVEEGLAKIHFSAEKSPYLNKLQIAEENARRRRAKIWSNYVEEKVEPEEPEETQETERKINTKSVIITEVTPELRFYVQTNEEGPKLEALMEQLRNEFEIHPPLAGAYTPKRGEMCAAKFVDGDWYRARVEKVTGQQVHVLYVDFGNREVTTAARCAALPGVYQTPLPFAKEYGLAFVSLPKDEDDAKEAVNAFTEDTRNRSLLLNVEFRNGGIDYVTLCAESTKQDIGKALVEDGLLKVEFRREKRFQNILREYVVAQDMAKKRHLNIWRYGDITDDDAMEFGVRR